MTHTKTADDVVNRQFTNNTSIVYASSVNFFKKGDIIYSLYYVKNGVSGQDIICEIQHGKFIYYLKINDYPIFDFRAVDYPLEMLFVTYGQSDLMLIVLPEESKSSKTLVVKVYKINYKPNVSLLQLYKMQLVSCDGYAREEVKYPVILHQDIVGRIIIIARVDNDYRGDATDRLYVMWKLEYKNDKFEVVNIDSGGYRKFNAAYLFKHSGYINRGKCRDRLIIKLGLNNTINFFYVGKHISKNYRFFSSMYNLSINYNVNPDPEECLIRSSYGCNASSNRQYDIPKGCIHTINVLYDGKDVYIAYVGSVFDSKFGSDKQLVIARTVEDEQLYIYDFVRVEENVSTVYISSHENVLAITIMGSDNLIRYEVSKLQLKSGIIDHIDIVNIPRNVIKNIADFTYVVDGVLGLNDVEYVSLDSVSATRSNVNYGISEFSLNIREVAFDDLLRNLSSLYGNFSTDVSTIPTSYGINYTTVMSDEALSLSTIRYLSSVVNTSNDISSITTQVSIGREDNIFRNPAGFVGHIASYVEPTSHIEHVTLPSKLPDDNSIVPINTKISSIMHPSATTTSVPVGRTDNMFEGTAGFVGHIASYVESTSHIEHVTLPSKLPDDNIIVPISTKTSSVMHTSATTTSVPVGRTDNMFEGTARFVEHIASYIEPTNHIEHVTLPSKLPDDNIVVPISTKTSSIMHTSATTTSVPAGETDNVFEGTARLVGHIASYVEPTSHIEHVTLPSKLPNSSNVSYGMKSTDGVLVKQSATLNSVLMGETYNNVSKSKKNGVKDNVQYENHSGVLLQPTGIKVSKSVGKKDKILGKKAKYNIRRSTIKSGINPRNKSTTAKTYTYNSGQDNISTDIMLFNLTQNSSSDYNSSLLNSNATFSTQLNSNNYKVIFSAISIIFFVFLLLGGFKCVMWYLAKLNRRRVSRNEQGFVMFDLDNIQHNVSGVQFENLTSRHTENTL
ncbi:hypothetical protein EDL79_00775 [Ehrlichia ruminantium]|uniref:Uncharacterized protein n=1 Tax=Ehrlichia ruminantium TaxID=779 RepID=A0AAE6QAW0_EHRRU|nr:hypothetical protein EDL81_00775 [Ehrlichia ruminantium]QGR03889.1 hypothetical protein EDL80_00775 [Ehrlichia ruminantium]QGR04814.1 hypothetical protein EDL79_00775 [Ehrlichia ruminantium]